MEYGNVKSFIKAHKKEGGTTIINYSGSTSNADKINAVSISSNAIDTTNLTAKNADIINANILYLMSSEGKITLLSGDDLKYTNGTINDLKSDVISTNKLTVKDTATIENIINNNLQSKNIVTDYLTVNKSAHFFELIIDKIRSVQGTQMNTAANCVVDFVEAYDSNNNKVDVESINVAYYRIYWKNTDDDGRAITNDWLVNDQALCESFNVGTGVSYDVSNKYYWRLVTNTDNGVPKYINLATGDVKSTQPSDYQIRFPNGFKFTAPAPDTFVFSDFTVTPQISGQWDDSTNTWTCTTTDFGLQLTYFTTNIDSSASQSYFICMPFSFTTNIETMLNIGVYYSDGSFDYFPATTYKTSYSITTADGKQIEAIIINSAVIDLYEACNWIDLSNVDMDATISGKSAIPSAGDNVCQLGYRYTELTNPTQDDINRASAIIIAAYNTPDNGIVPPSYAQYQNITDYSLGSHRKSYFDATGCYIVGNFAVQAAGSTTPLDDYIKSFNNANPLEGFISTNNNQTVDLIVLQTDNSNKIYDLNNFPNNLQVMVNYEGTPQMSISDYDALTLTLFGVQYNLLDANNYTPNLPSGYQGIYVSNITKSQYQPFRLTLAFTGNEQVITTSSMILHAEITNNGTTYQLNKNIPINNVSSVKGTDAELWQLYKDTEYAEVQQNKSLNVQLRYAIQHIVGLTSEFYTPTTQKLKVTRYNLSGTGLDTRVLTSTDYITTGGKSGNGYWEYTYTLQNWYSDQNKPIYIGVELLDSNNNVLDNTLVEIMLDTSSLFTVEEGLTQSIQANTTAINDEVQTRQTQYSSISQTVNNINTTVARHTTSIGQMTTDISEIDQKADRIGLHVDSVETDLNGVVTDLSSTGIDIEQGKITLSADNTIIDGNLHLSGDFTSENSAMMNKAVIDSMNGGIRLYGPNSVDDNGNPTQSAQQKLITDIGYGTDPDSNTRYGYAHFYDAKHSEYNTIIDNQSLYITDPYNTVNISSGGISWNDSQNNSGSLEMAQLLFRRLRVARPNANWYDAKMTDDMITSDYDAAMSINLPDPLTSDGKFYFIKHKKDKNTNIRCTAAENRGDSVIMNDDSESVDWQRNVQNNSTLVFCDGIHWILMELDY